MMVLYNFVAGSPARSSEVNANFSAVFRYNILGLITALQDRSVTFSGDGGYWAEAYVDADGRLNSVDTDLTTATFDTDKYKGGVPTYYVLIEGTGIDTDAFAINNCGIYEYESDKYVLTCSTGTDEVQRAQIYKTLFYGTDGSDPALDTGNFTTITAIKTSASRDVGKVATFEKHTANMGNSSPDSGETVFAFSDTSTNTDCSLWTVLTRPAGSLGNATSTVYFPSTNALFTRNTDGTTSTYTLGVAASTIEDDNPDSLKITYNNTSGNTGTYVSENLLIYKGTLGTGTFTTSGVGLSYTENIRTDFNTDNGIPAFEAATSFPGSIITHDIPSGTFSSTISSCVGSPKYEDYEEGVDVQYKLTADFDEDVYVIVEASALSGYSSSYDTKAIEYESGKWVVYCTADVSDEAKRAKIYADLFDKDTQNILNFSSITAVKTTDSDDVGKRFHTSYLADDDGAGAISTYTGTFVDTSTNTDCSTWSDLYLTNTSGTLYARWEVPSGTTLHSIGAFSNPSYEIGTDRSADETDNPATCQSDLQANSGTTFWVKSLILCSGDITWAVGGSPDTTSNIDYYTDYSIPDLTSASALSYSEDSGWLDTNEVATFTAFEYPPTQCVVKLIPKTTSPTSGYPSINGFGILEF